MHYDCQIEGDLLVCTLTPDRALSGAVFCCSGMAPMAAISGGSTGRTLGSYTEVALPDIAAHQPHRFELHYTGGYTPTNRAWMPLGPHLRHGAEVIELAATPPGCRPQAYADTPLEGLPIAPQPTQWKPSGETVSIDGFTLAGGAMDAVAALAQRQKMGFRGTHPVTLIDAALPPDAYRLTITPKGTTLAAASYGGQFYGGITLLSLLQHGPLPCGDITDIPRFEWRGQHLDTARHFYAPDTITALLDLMALLKLNRFHWHFADDEAFRLELESLPELAQKTALRGEGQLLPALFAGSPVEGGTYSKDTARAIIAHAAALNIEVMPEIETPGHALALAAIYPEMRDPGDNGVETSVQGYASNAINPAMPKTWEVLEAMVDEVSALFPFNHLHLGCDELPDDTWMSSPRARALMAEHGLKDTHDLQGWMMAKLGAFATRKGQRPAAWEEAARGANGGIGNDAILFSWTGQGPGLDAAAAGYDVVMTPAQHVYLDMAQTEDPDDWGASWAGFVDLLDTIAWDPAPTPALQDRIIGVQGAFWSEFTTQDQQMWPMLMPRMLGVAMMAWQTDSPDADTLVALSHRYHVDETGRVTLG